MTRYRFRFRSLIIVLFLVALIIPLSVAKISVSQPSAMELATQARSLYVNRDYRNAAVIWQRVANIFAEENDVINQGMALSNLSLTYQQLGEWERGKENIDRSLTLLQQGEKSPESWQTLASSWEIQGKLQLATGEEKSALDSWQTATRIYRQLEDRTAIARSQLNQAQVMQNLGLYPKACQTVTKALALQVKDCAVTAEVLQNWETDLDSELKVSGLVSLGNILRVMGEHQRSQEVLLIAEKLGKTAQLNLATVYFALGNNSGSLAQENSYFVRSNRARNAGATDYETIVADYWQNARQYYQKAIALTEQPLTILQGKVNLLDLSLQDRQRISSTLITEINSLLQNIPGTSEKITSQIKFARSLLELPTDNIKTSNIEAIIQNAIAESQTLGGKRNQAFALATLGLYYEREQQWELADTSTKQALSYATGYDSQDITSELFWQLGRIEQAQNKRQAAINSYTRAYDLLQSLRSDLVATNPNTQFAFRDRIEPVYRELVELLLVSDVEPSQEELVQARQVIESLQLAELDNFFQEACIQSNPVQIDEIEPNTAILYSILLKNRLEVIVSLPNGKLLHQSNLTEQPIEGIISSLRNTIALENFPDLASRSSALTEAKLRSDNPSRGIGLFRTNTEPKTSDFHPYSQQLYNWLVAPFTQELTQNKVNTLVFVLDGVLRNIPMTILHDGEQYLIEKYAVVLTPGMQLLDPKPLLRNRFNTLTAGLSKRSPSFDEFSALPNVEQELASIEKSIPTKTLLNESFTEKKLATKIDAAPFPIVHIATHGKFSSVAEETYILAWDNPIDAKELNQLLQGKTRANQPIELLVLSACQTALGDERAILGLAGVAMRGGAKSTLASLWLVNDESTALLMEKFYQALAQGNISKAEALRQAQVAVLHSEKFYDPYFWSAFVLVGNWL